jgi:hypothetical protein
VHANIRNSDFWSTRNKISLANRICRELGTSSIYSCSTPLILIRDGAFVTAVGFMKANIDEDSKNWRFQVCLNLIVFQEQPQNGTWTKYRQILY